MDVWIADKKKARVIGHVGPFVEVERQQIRGLYSCHQRAQLRRKSAHRAERAIDVKPQLFSLTQVGERTQIVEGAGVHRTCGPDHQERLQPVSAVTGDGLLKQVEPDRPSASTGMRRKYSDPIPDISADCVTQPCTCSDV